MQLGFVVLVDAVCAVTAGTALWLCRRGLVPILVLVLVPAVSSIHGLG